MKQRTNYKALALPAIFKPKDKLESWIILSRSWFINIRSWSYHDPHLEIISKFWSKILGQEPCCQHTYYRARWLLPTPKIDVRFHPPVPEGSSGLCHTLKFKIECLITVEHGWLITITGCSRRWLWYWLLCSHATPPMEPLRKSRPLKSC